MTVGLLVVDRRSGFVEGPRGYLSLPADAVEVAPGLYEVMPYLLPDPDIDGLFLAPEPSRQDYFYGGRSNIVSYSVQEESTPIDPGSMEGGAGQITVSFNEGTDTLWLAKEVVQFADTHRNRGMIEGVVRNLAVTDGAVTMTMDSAMALFNSDHIIPPTTGRFDAVLMSYCSRVGVTNPLSVHPSVASRQVQYPAIVGNVWDRLKQIMARERVEMTLIGDTIVVRPLRTVEARLDNFITLTTELNDQNTARAVEVAYYNNTWRNNGEVYPVPNEEPAVYTVDAGEVVEVEIQMSASLRSVNQPTAVDFVENRPYPGGNGVYAVAGNDGKPVKASQWLAQGGSVHVSLADDPSILKVRITGASMEQYAPYRIAMTAGTSNYYNALHITGTGLFYDRQTVTIPTGASSAVTGEEVGMVVENPYISTREEAYSLGAQTAKAWAGTQTISGSATTIQPTTDVQAFGNAAGARVREGDAIYRIRSATTSESTVDFSADLDTTIADFNAEWAGATIADFNLMWSDRLLKDFNSEPLRRDQ